ncbi:MAG TPA: ParA family protein [Micromonosporaceae bacterium]|nr:ParA family protein [Micromonosporaceae bacterium]
MAIIAVASAKGSPGVTTTCLALALTWPRSVLLVEADPAGGDVMAGYVRAELGGDRGLAYLAVAARRGSLDEELGAQVIDLTPEKQSANTPPITRLLVPGVTDPVESAGVAPSWPRLADFFVALGQRASGQQRAGGSASESLDVIVDCGRLISTYPPLTVMASADLVLLAVRSSLRSASSTAPVVATLRRELAAGGGDPDRVGLVVVEGGEYRTSDLGRALGAPVLATIPWREKEAAALSDGIGKVVDNSPLMRAARKTAESLAAQVSRSHHAAEAVPAQPGGADVTYPGVTYPGVTYPGVTYPAGTYGGYPVAGAAPPAEADAPPGMVRR